MTAGLDPPCGLTGISEAAIRRGLRRNRLKFSPQGPARSMLLAGPGGRTTRACCRSHGRQPCGPFCPPRT